MSIRRFLAPWALALSTFCVAQSPEVISVITGTLTSVRTRIIQQKEIYPLLSRIEESKVHVNGIYYSFSYEQGTLKRATKRTAKKRDKENGVEISITIIYPLDASRQSIPNFEITFPDQTILTCSSYVVTGDTASNAGFVKAINSIIDEEKGLLIHRLSLLGGRAHSDIRVAQNLSFPPDPWSIVSSFTVPSDVMPEGVQGVQGVQGEVTSGVVGGVVGGTGKVIEVDYSPISGPFASVYIAYPERAKANKIEGAVVLQIEYLKDQAPPELRITAISGPEELRETAIACARNALRFGWSFLPAEYINSFKMGIRFFLGCTSVTPKLILEPKKSSESVHGG